MEDQRMIMEKPDANPVSEYLGGLTARNERTYREALDLLARKIPWASFIGGEVQTYNALSASWSQLNPDEATRIRRALTEGEWINEAGGQAYSATTVNRFLQALKGVLRQYWRQELMPAEVYLDTVAKLPSIPQSV